MTTLADRRRRDLSAGDRAGTVLVTGATGFIGSHVVGALRARGATIRTAGRTELASPGAIARSMAGADAVVHCVSAVSGAAAELHHANVEVAGVVAAAARSAGVHRLVAVSTAAVTGHGPHRGGPVPPVRPASAVSASRAAGEDVLLGAGATIVRPNLVWGAGDRWVVPTLARMLGRTDAVATWDARVSTVGVRDLARGLSALALGPDGVPGAPRVLHADAVGALPVAAIGEWIQRHLVRSVEPSTAPTLSAHQLSMLAVDNWFDGSRFWELAGVRPGPAFAPTRDDLAWYRGYLAT